MTINKLSLLAEKALEEAVAPGYSFADAKDVERADNLNTDSRGGFNPGGNQPFVLSNAVKMAKVITDKRKILGRLEAVLKRWNMDLARPFAKRVLELWPDSIYTKAYHTGLSDGSAMGSSVAYDGNTVEKIMYNFGFAVKRRGIMSLERD